MDRSENRFNKNKTLTNDVHISYSKSLSLLFLPIEKINSDIERGPNIVYLIIESIDENTQKVIALYILMFLMKIKKNMKLKNIFIILTKFFNISY